jgi:shikimate kinase
MGVPDTSSPGAADPIRSVRSLFLIGARGSGKTTVGRLVAERLGLPFFDADVVLEEQEGRAIREIFAAEGESWFRDREELALAQLIAGGAAVIATGGGAVVRVANRERMRRSGWVVWLRADVETLWQRLLDDPATSKRRPNLSVGGKAEIEELLSIREPLYRACANFEVCSAGRSPDAVASDIVAQCSTSCWIQPDRKSVV